MMKKNFVQRSLSSLVLIPLTFFFIIKGSYFFNLFILLVFLTVCFEWHTISKKNPLYFIGFIFFVFSFYSVFYLRNEINDDYSYLLSVILICIFTDLGGYFFGKIFKGPKLGKISPNKTYSGIFGGYFLSLVFMYFVYEIKLITSQYLILNLNFVIFVLLLSFISQAGDLIISYFKRLAKIKDTGKIIPGHGGLLDRFDGMLFAIPASYILLESKIFY